jgi:ABC-type nitrate/sulfonate/bicarbonate transport system permease component
MAAESSVADRARPRAVTGRGPVYRGLGAVGRYLRSIVPALVLWHLLAIVVDNHAILPTPVHVADAVADLTASGELLRTAGSSLVRLGIAYGIAVAICVPVGVVMGTSRMIRDLIDPVVELLRPISGIAWIPLALIIFGVGSPLVVFIIIYGAAFPLILNTVAGVRDVDPQLIAAARTFGLSRLTRLWQVTLPAALPTILVGCRIAMGTAWMSLIAAELVGAPTGLGFAVEWYRELLMTPKMIASVLAIGVLGYTSDVLLRLLTRRVTPWATGVGVGR